MAFVTFPERVANRASSVNVGRVLLSLLALPFYLAGLLVGLLLVVVVWGYSAVLVGVDDVRSRDRRGDV